MALTLPITMSNDYQNNYFPDDSDPAGQAEYLAQVAWNSQAQSQNNGLGYYGVPPLQPHAGREDHENLGYNNFNQRYPLPEAPVSPPPTYTMTQARPLLPPFISSPHSNSGASLSRPSTPVATALVPTQPNTPVVSRRTEFSAKEYLGVARAMVDTNPFAAKHGQKGAAWDKVAAAVQAQGLFPRAKTDVIKNKALALIKYQEVCMRSHSSSIHY
jgi:hypothetical protein